MRRHAVSTMSNNFGYMYINLFQKRFLANGLARKTKNSCTELLVIIIKKRMVENISGDWKDKLENFSKRIQEEENMT